MLVLAQEFEPPSSKEELELAMLVPVLARLLALLLLAVIQESTAAAEEPELFALSAFPNWTSLSASASGGTSSS